ncbi:hypothetical protein [Rugamonas apoptosis]|uniref:Uncharacterized protein n=1 Tax=Rugamonas apoptosis TaxID=2758570 RepID=A0A7W2FF15_9BURK|nr:hypothetical protein [Rugamonas apoptosis]MBA5690432.1 hypothetical protein [Rugamonas apoptosis]
MQPRPSIIAALLFALALPTSAMADDATTPPQVLVPAARDAEWHSYRHAYQAARFFAPFLATRPLIQAHMQIRPNTPDEPMDGLQVQLAGESVNQTIAVDALGRATLPMLKQAYDEDAVLRLNRRKGHYHFSGRFSIRERDDGIYSAADLRAACEQLLSAQRASGYRLRLIGKRCAGVTFVYAPDDTTAQVRHRDASGKETPLAIAPGAAFEGPPMGSYRVAQYRYANWPEQGQLLISGHLLAVGTIYE